MQTFLSFFCLLNTRKLKYKLYAIETQLSIDSLIPLQCVIFCACLVILFTMSNALKEKVNFVILFDIHQSINCSSMKVIPPQQRSMYCGFSLIAHTFTISKLIMSLSLIRSILIFIQESWRSQQGLNQGGKCRDILAIYRVSGDVDTIFCGEKSLKIGKKSLIYWHQAINHRFNGEKQPKKKKIANILAIFWPVNALQCSRYSKLQCTLKNAFFCAAEGIRLFIQLIAS